MLTTYFKRRATVAAYHSGPAGADLDPFTAWLAIRGYGNDSVRFRAPDKLIASLRGA